MPARRLRVVLADDHQIVLEGLSRILGAEFDLVATATDGLALLDAVKRHDPDVVIVDVSMPRLNGIDATRQLIASGSRAKVVCLSMHPDVTYATRALDAGASAYVLKHAASDELVDAIRTVMRGGRFLSEAVRTPAAEELAVEPERHQKTSVELTPRQRQILQLLAEGHSARAVGEALSISPRTVESHKYKMMEDLGLSSTAQLVQYAIRQGLLPPAGHDDP